ncbi:hypothetical protein BCR44DRAFT_44632 [Catenaria anguillulae PL171]|uniref:Uncharacterized protein n=1 Tax=Catenaria anguillulae PL171 TaxID=765915 RepID=A0A1Y2HUH9_9FUNG|nr:hypothetical protein BCR44DRAFT_44632 [Catenaria anguillulae PL171]
MFGWVEWKLDWMWNQPKVGIETRVGRSYLYHGYTYLYALPLGEDNCHPLRARKGCSQPYNCMPSCGERMKWIAREVLVERADGEARTNWRRKLGRIKRLALARPGSPCT